ncbi:hypothetical protein [Halopiger xanaduensis]|uniref:Uncharacterized protein n=1 Tax=Halopiger xanaduensis (strain DSM 18323 / JCM 14033 / SH-6) TaxID=797210 RepID=F8D8W4_HALXS|nr:hypothetical protein [Halopiger xanaduensis]AEH38032.1 hypothetical protein Halxa_3421 [Halopiger xanaduensis SH-6]
MKRLGLFDMLQIAAGLSMAGPMFVVGFEFVRTGRLVGGVGFLALGAFALYFPTYLVNRIGGPRAWLRRRIGRTRSGSSESNAGSGPAANDGSDTDTTAADAGTSAGLLERLRRE